VGCCDPDPGLSPSSRAWLTVALLAIVGVLNYLDRVMITTMRSSITDAIPMTEAQFGLLTTVFLLVYAVLSPFAGFLADRFQRRVVIIMSLLTWSVVTWLTARAQTYGQLLATRALMGVSEACYIPAALAVIVDYHRGPTRSLAVGIHLSGAILGGALGGVGGWVAEHHTWQQPFRIFGLVGVAFAIVLMLLLREPPRENVPEREPNEGMPAIRIGSALAHLFGQKSFLLVIVFWSLLSLSNWAVVGWMPTYLGEHFHLSQGRAGLTATLYVNGASLLGVLAGGFWADRWSLFNPRARMLVPAIGLALAAPAIMLAASTPFLALAIVGLVAFGLTRAFSDSNMMPILCLISDSRYRATGYGVLNFFACVSGGITIYLGGAMRDAHVNINHVFQFGAIGVLVSAGLLLFVRTQSDPWRRLK
jgi:predicted MFS family arabinose efflux permease